MPPSPPPREYLLVEGNSDQRVIEALCELHGVPKPTIRMPVRGGGIEQLLESVPGRIVEPGLRRLGIVVDADVLPPSRWQALRDRLQDSGKLQELTYTTVPAAPPAGGWISAEPDRPRVGVWIMPDNTSAGMLEDFAARLIPNDDPLLTRAKAVLDELEQGGLNRYSLAHRPKVLIHTWLAWQREPGQPLGIAIAKQSLRHDTPLARTFVDWLRRLFDL